jgi:hypothetical protein
MEPRKERTPNRRVTPRMFVLAIAAVAIVALLIVSQVPQRAAGADAQSAAVSLTTAPGAKLTIKGVGFTCWPSGCVSSVATSSSGTPSPCYRPEYQIAVCNVTISTSGSVIESLNYTVIGSSTSPTSFYYINSDPALPVSNYPASFQVSLWFHVNQAKGSISAFVDFALY